jgi:hypothetical protein
MDAIIIKWVGENIITIGICLALLRGLAEISTFEWDNKLCDLLDNAISTLTRRNKG